MGKNPIELNTMSFQKTKYILASGKCFMTSGESKYSLASDWPAIGRPRVVQLPVIGQLEWSPAILSGATLSAKTKISHERNLRYASTHRTQWSDPDNSIDALTVDD